MLNIFEEELLNHVFEYDVVLIPMGINNSFDTGFAKDIYTNFKGIKEAEANLTGYGDKRKYGAVVETSVEGVSFAFCYINKGGYRGGDSVDYTALESCLSTIAKRYGKKKVGAPLLGYGKFDGNGDKERIKALFEKWLSGANVDLYIFENVDRHFEFFREIAEARKKLRNKEITAEEYSKVRSEIEWRRRNGTLKEMPEDYVYTPKRPNVSEQVFVKKTDFGNKK